MIIQGNSSCELFKIANFLSDYPYFPKEERMAVQTSVRKDSIPDIFLYKGKMVIPDYELAHYFGVKNETIKTVFESHRDLFPRDIVFMARNSGTGKNKKQKTILFTEQSATLLAGLIKNTDAVKANMRLLRVFRLLDYIIAV